MAGSRQRFPARAVLVVLAAAMTLAGGGAGLVLLRGDGPSETAVRSASDEFPALQREAQVPEPEVPAETTVVPTTASSATIPVPTSAVPAVAPTDGRLGDAEKAAKKFVGAIGRRDCPAVLAMLAARTRSFFEESEGGDGASPGASFCGSLASEDIPPMTVRGPARALSNDRVVIDLESAGETEELILVREGGDWKVDLLGAMDGDAPRDV